MKMTNQRNLLAYRHWAPIYDATVHHLFMPGRKRALQRGYNQVNLIARPLSTAMRVAYAPSALRRSRETRSQVGLSRTERQDNVRNAFCAEEHRVNGCIVLLMDDVATTGSTLSSCAEALYGAGARDVFAYTVSRAMPRHGLGNV